MQWDIQTFETLPSTQDECIRMAENGADESLVIQAFEQTQGRGRRGRVWEDCGKNLSCSILLRPSIDVQNVGHISILVGVALAETVKACTSFSPRLKWPNDVLIEGKKCAGILIDSSIQGTALEWLVIGMGVNTQSAPDGAMALNTDREAFLKHLLREIEGQYSLYQAQGFEAIRQSWIENSFAQGAALNVGAFETLDDFGNLVVRDDKNALKTISAGDVMLKGFDYAACG